jgi:hypothetical protein
MARSGYSGPCCAVRAAAGPRRQRELAQEVVDVAVDGVVAAEVDQRLLELDQGGRMATERPGGGGQLHADAGGELLELLERPTVEPLALAEADGRMVSEFEPPDRSVARIGSAGTPRGRPVTRDPVRAAAPRAVGGNVRANRSRPRVAEPGVVGRQPRCHAHPQPNRPPASLCSGWGAPAALEPAPSFASRMSMSAGAPTTGRAQSPCVPRPAAGRSRTILTTRHRTISTATSDRTGVPSGVWRC